MNLNYEFGVSEVITLQELPNFVLDAKTGILLDGIYSFAMSSPVLYTDSAGLTAVPVNDYTLEIDGDYTTREAEDGGTNATIYKSITITNATYAGVPLYVSGNNYGSYTDNEAIQAQINQLKLGINPVVGTKAVSMVSGDTDLLNAGYKQYAFDNAISQANYSALFNKYGHMFNQQHVDAGDADLSGSSTLFYPTPVPGKYARSAFESISLTDANFDFANNWVIDLPLWMSQNRRDGVLFNLEIVSGTLPTGLTEKGYYVRFNTQAGEIRLYNTESDAIIGTSTVTFSDSGSGTFRLTQEGIAIDDVFQGHWHTSSAAANQATDPRQFDVNSGTTNTVLSLQSTGSDAGTGLYPSDGVNGTPRTSNETRGTTYYEFEYIKATSTTANGTPIDEVIEDSGWINSDNNWKGTTKSIVLNNFTINSITDVRVAFYYRNEPLVREQNIFDSMSARESMVVGDSYGVNAWRVNSTTINCDIAVDGFFAVNDAKQTSLINDADLGDYRIVVTKINKITTYAEPTTQKYTLDAVTDTHTLLDATSTLQKQTIFWDCTNGGRLNFATASGQTIGGLAASKWFGEGKGSMTVIPVSGNYEVDSYDDYIEIADSGNEDRRIARKYKGNKIEIIGRTINLLTSTWTVVNIGYTVVDSLYNRQASLVGGGYADVSIRSSTTTTFEIRQQSGSTQIADWSLVGKWQ